MAKSLHRLRDHGRVTKSEVEGWGYNCRLDNVQAAILSWRLRQLPRWIEHRRALARIYDERLAGIEGLGLPVGPDSDPVRRDVFQNYPVLTQNRDGLVDHLRNSGIEVLVSWPVPLHLQAGLGLEHWSLPRTEQLSRQVLSLPLNAELETSEAELVSECVRSFFGLPS